MEQKQEYTHLYKSATTNEEAIARLIELVRVLRVECPWDREQTHESLRKCLLEEAYETVEAINNCDADNLEEEVGDVLLQVIFHSQLGEEADKFDFVSVTNRECEKMIRRHPHIFCTENVKSIDKALEKWENVKRIEKGVSDYTSDLTGVPKALPALMRSYKVQSKAAKVGFDWDHVGDAFHKIKEEAEELESAYAKSDAGNIKEELGDLLFSVVNVARFLNVDPEEALNSTSDKFIRRFAYIEKRAKEMNLDLESMSLEDMDKLWDEAKILERV